MKPEELQVMDWVYSLIDIDGNTVREPQRIRGISVDTDGAEEICTINTDKNDVWYRIETFEPIPLTTEILLKNGLERDSFGRIWGVYFEEDEHERLEITVDDKTSEVWWSYNWDEYRIIKLEYLHQLQHAMRLCGIDKEIKL